MSRIQNTATKDISASGEASSLIQDSSNKKIVICFFCWGKFWPALIWIPSPDPLTHLNPDPKYLLSGMTFSKLPCMLRIRDVYPGSQVQILSSRIQGQKDSGSRIRIRIKNLSIFNPKNTFSALGNMIRDVHPGSRIRILIFYPSRIQGSKRHQSPDPPHCLLVVDGFHGILVHGTYLRRPR